MNKQLTKEECLKLLYELRDSSYEIANDDIGWDFYPKDIDVQPLIDLINEHFDNPPLKFEELEPDMWVWDNKIKEYLRVYDLEPTNKRFWLGTICYMNFEENRFYRKEVKHD